jgi:oligopeptide/dipeptide ABC transporter ATP-binding protein
MSQPLLKVEDLAVSIGGQEIVSNVAFEIGAGQCLGLVGETGSGKSMTCRVLIGMLPYIGGRVTRGRATFDGIDLTRLNERAWRDLRGRRIGFIPQSSLSGLDPLMTVGRQLTETIAQIGGEGSERAAAEELLDRVQMPHSRHVFDSYPHELSGGMRQRVMIALGISGNPDLLVADEPTTALDVTVQREILDLLADLRRQTQMTVLLITHDLGVVLTMTDSVAIMYAGQTVESGRSAEVLEHPAHPYTQALLAARPSVLATNGRLNSIAGAPPDPKNWPAGCRLAPRCPRCVAACVAAPPAVSVLEGGRSVRCIRSVGSSHLPVHTARS